MRTRSKEYGSDCSFGASVNEVSEVCRMATQGYNSLCSKSSDTSEGLNISKHVDKNVKYGKDRDMNIDIKSVYKEKDKSGKKRKRKSGESSENEKLILKTNSSLKKCHDMCTFPLDEKTATTDSQNLSGFSNSGCVSACIVATPSSRTMDGGTGKSTSVIKGKVQNKNIIDQTSIKATRKKRRVFSVDDDDIHFQNPHFISKVNSTKSSKNTPQSVNATSSQANIGTYNSDTCWRKSTTDDTKVKVNNQCLKLEPVDQTQLKIKLTDKLSLNQNAIKETNTKFPDNSRPVCVEKSCKHAGLSASHKSKSKANGDTNRSTVLKKVVECATKTVKKTPEVDLQSHPKPITLTGITGSTFMPSLDGALKLSNQREESSHNASRAIQLSSDKRTLNVYLQKNNTRNERAALSTESLREKNDKSRPVCVEKSCKHAGLSASHKSKSKGNGDTNRSTVLKKVVECATKTVKKTPEVDLQSHPKPITLKGLTGSTFMPSLDGALKLSNQREESSGNASRAIQLNSDKRTLNVYLQKNNTRNERAALSTESLREKNDKSRPVCVEKSCKHAGLSASHKSKSKGNGDTNRSTVLKKVVECATKTVKKTPEVDLQSHPKPITLTGITGSTSMPSLDGALKLSNQREESSGNASRAIQLSSDKRTLNVYLQKNNTRNHHAALSTESLREKNAKKETGDPPSKQKLPTGKTENTYNKSKTKDAISSSVSYIERRTSGPNVNLSLKASLEESSTSKSESRDKCHEEHNSDCMVCMESNRFSEKQETAPKNKKHKLPVTVIEKVHDDSIFDIQSKIHCITKQSESDKMRSKYPVIHKPHLDEAKKLDEACKSVEITCKGIKRRKTKDESDTTEVSRKCKNAEVENRNTLPIPGEPQNKANRNTRVESLCKPPILEEEKGSSSTDASIKDIAETGSKVMTTMIDICTAKVVSDLLTDDSNAENAVKILRKFITKPQWEQSMQPSCEQKPNHKDSKPNSTTNPASSQIMQSHRQDNYSNELTSECKVGNRSQKQSTDRLLQDLEKHCCRRNIDRIVPSVYCGKQSSTAEDTTMESDNALANLISNRKGDLSKSPDQVKSTDKATASPMSNRGGGLSRSPNKVKSNKSLKGRGKVQANSNRFHQMPKLLAKSRQQASEIYKCLGGGFKPPESKAKNVLPMEVNTQKPTKEHAASENASTSAASDKLKPSVQNQIYPEVQPEKVLTMSMSDASNTVAGSVSSVRILPTFNQGTDATQKSLEASSNVLVAQPVCQTSEKCVLISIPEVAALTSEDHGLLLETEYGSVESKFSNTENENVSASVTFKSSENTLDHSQSVTRCSNNKADISKMASSDINNEPRVPSLEDIMKVLDEVNYMILRYEESKMEISVSGRNVVKKEPKKEKDCSVLENTQQTDANDNSDNSQDMSNFPRMRVKDIKLSKSSDFCAKVNPPSVINDPVGTVTPTMPPAEKTEGNENMQMMMKLILGNFYPAFSYEDLIKEVVSGGHVNYVQRQAMIEPLEGIFIQLVDSYKKELSKPGRSEVAIVTELEEMIAQFMIPPLTSKEIAQWLTNICKFRAIIPLRAFVDSSGYIMGKRVIEVIKRDGKAANSSASVPSTQVRNSENSALTVTSSAPPTAASVISCAATNDKHQNIVLHASPSSVFAPTAQVPQHSIPLQQYTQSSPPNVSLGYSGQHGYRQPAYTGTGHSNATTGETPRVSGVHADPNKVVYQGPSYQATQQLVNTYHRFQCIDSSQTMNIAGNQQANPGVPAATVHWYPMAQQSGYPLVQYQSTHNPPEQQQSYQEVPHTNNMHKKQRPIQQMQPGYMNSSYQGQQSFLQSSFRCSTPSHYNLGDGFVKQPPPYDFNHNIIIPQPQYQQNSKFSQQQNPYFPQQQNHQFPQRQNTQFPQQQKLQFLHQQNTQFLQQQNPQFSQQRNQSLLGLLRNNPLQQGSSTSLTTPQIGEENNGMRSQLVENLQKPQNVLPVQSNSQAKELTLPNLLASQHVLMHTGQPTNQIDVQVMKATGVQQVASEHQPPGEGQIRLDRTSAPLSNSQPTVHVQATEVTSAQRYSSVADEMSQHNCQSRIHKQPITQNQKVDQLFQMKIPKVQAQIHLGNQNQQQLTPVQNQQQLDHAHTEQQKADEQQAVDQQQKAQEQQQASLQQPQEQQQAELCWQQVSLRKQKTALHQKPEAREQQALLHQQQQVPALKEEQLPRLCLQQPAEAHKEQIETQKPPQVVQHPQIQPAPSSREHPPFNQVSNNIELHVHELYERNRSVTSLPKQTSSDSVHNTAPNQSSQRVKNGKDQLCSGVASSSNPTGSIPLGAAISSANMVANEDTQLNAATKEEESEPDIIEVYASLNLPRTTSRDSSYKTPSPAVVKQGVKTENENRVITAAKCILCQKPAELICSACMHVFYCSIHCQTQHWDASHQHTCQMDNEDNCQD